MTGETTTADSNIVTAAGFDPVETLPLQDWLKRETDDHGEYIHLLPDPENEQLHCFRSIGDVDENKRVQTTIGNIRFSFYTEQEGDQVEYFYVTSGEAQTVLTWLTALSCATLHPNRTLYLTYDEDNGKGMYDDLPITEESLTLRYTTADETQRKVQINNTWTANVHMLAKLESKPRWPNT